jgi:hypothetical protein
MELLKLLQQQYCYLAVKLELVNLQAVYELIQSLGIARGNVNETHEEGPPTFVPFSAL